MRAVVQRVLNANVKIERKVHAEIEKGLLVLLGVRPEDDEKAMEYMTDKLTNIRIFEDENGKMNKSVKDIGGEILIVPNFTLYGDARKGRRPGFTAAGSPAEAQKVFEKFIENIKGAGVPIKTGVFQADMNVNISNDGPVTILLDSDKLF
ncbi:MAG: D-tyrosyl-tRNA(Tyr) deacylase [Firmicutes bacterium]|nr:D-tyrosyl-tRNA(Tyr) deacylase [Bacillota bacterium]